MTETPPALARLLALVQGFRSTQVTYVIAKLGLADQLAESPLTAIELAARVKVDAPSLSRLLRLAAFYGLVNEIPGDRFELTPLGQPLRAGVEGSINATAMMLGEEHYGAWANLLHSIRTGEPAFDHVYGAPFFDYMANHPETQSTFDAAMSAGVDVLLKSLVDSYDFSKTRVIVDVGGGNGSLSAMIVKRFPNMQGVIYDQPQVLEAAENHLSKAGVRNRFRLVPGDFFSSIPDGGDLYFLSNIVHDWDDERALRILQNVRAAMTKDAAVLLLEAVLPEHGTTSPAAMADVNMLVLLTGRERTEDQYRLLLRNADLRLTKVIPVWERESLIEAKPQ